MAGAKIRLSQKEAEIIGNSDLILTKNAVLQKVNGLLNNIQEHQSILLQQYATALPAAIRASSPKIARGENYNGLPWLMLDYPRVFDHENIFAIRTFFWWGNFFSVTLHLSGNYKTVSEQKIIRSFPSLSDFSICINEEQWQHHFEETNYRSLHSMDEGSFAKLVQQSSFIKLANTITIDKWDDAPGLLTGFFEKLLSVYKG